MHLHRSLALIGITTLWLPAGVAQAAAPSGCAHPARAQIIGSTAWLDYCVLDGKAVLEDMILGEHQEIQNHGVRLPGAMAWQRKTENQQRDAVRENAPEPAKRRGKRAMPNSPCAGSSPGYPHNGYSPNYPGLNAGGYCPTCSNLQGCNTSGHANPGQYRNPRPEPRYPRHNTTPMAPPDYLRPNPSATPTTNAYGNTTWPQNIVYYAVDQATPGTRAALQSAIAEIESHTHVRFVLRTQQPDYINVVTRPLPGNERRWTCGLSYVGKTGGAQELAIAPQCETTWTALHELQHALGFPHQHIQDGEQLTQAEIQGINASYPALHIARADAIQGASRRIRRIEPSMPKPQINSAQLEIDQNGLGKAQIYIDGPQTKLWRMGPENPRLGSIQTVATRVSERQYNITLIPAPSFVGHSRLHFTFTNQTGQTRTVSLDLHVKAKASAPWRQLVSRHGNNQCLAAGASKHTKLRLYHCMPGSQQQQWRQYASGQIESLAHSGYCLTPNSTSHGSQITLTPCTPYAKEQRWKKTTTQWRNVANPQLLLSSDSRQQAMLYPLVQNAQWQAWDWR